MSTGAIVTPTPGERLLICRRRKNHGQVEEAAEYGVHPDLYREWEADRGGEIPRVLPGELKPHEVCLLLRRRAKMTQNQLARLMKCTRLWVIQMENGDAPVDRLTTYWGV